jgi:CelD/BcsL family acetyltransferase involved in cellulose biosynthesis
VVIHQRGQSAIIPAYYLPAIIDYGFAHGFTEYDFLSGEEAYKQHWATGFHLPSRILVWNDRLKSRAYSAYMSKRITSKLSPRSEAESEG